MIVYESDLCYSVDQCRVLAAKNKEDEIGSVCRGHQDLDHFENQIFSDQNLLLAGLSEKLLEFFVSVINQNPEKLKVELSLRRQVFFGVR